MSHFVAGSAKGRVNPRGRTGIIFAILFVSFGLMGSMILTPSSTAATPDDFPNFRRHQEQYWVWFGPPRWIASSGLNALNISSPTGVLWNKYEEGGIICPKPAAHWSRKLKRKHARTWFRQLRRFYRKGAKHGFGIYSHPMRQARFTKVKKVRKLPEAAYGPSYFRQRIRWTGRRKRGRKVIRGQLILDMFKLYDPAAGIGVCGQRVQARGAPARRNAKKLKKLRFIQTTITPRNRTAP